MSSGITSEYIDNEVFKVLKHIAEAIQKTSTTRYKGPYRALRCEVIISSSRLRLPADFPVLGRVVAGPHKFVIATAILRHLYK
jgi:hypothetical protein